MVGEGRLIGRLFLCGLVCAVCAGRINSLQGCGTTLTSYGQRGGALDLRVFPNCSAICEGFNALDLTQRDRLPAECSSWVSSCLRCIFPIMLALLVLGWGTGYKLSLYNTQANHDGTPTAKLSTSASDAAKSGMDDAAAGHSVEQAASIVAFFVIPTMVIPPQRRGERDNLAQNLSPFRFTPPLFLRPPPAELSAIE